MRSLSPRGGHLGEASAPRAGGGRGAGSFCPGGVGEVTPVPQTAVLPHSSPARQRRIPSSQLSSRGGAGRAALTGLGVAPTPETLAIKLTHVCDVLSLTSHL